MSGDVLEVNVDIAEGAAALFTTPGAARVYRARQSLSQQRQITRLSAASAATIEWFPLETIIYDGADVDSRTEVHLHRDARCILWEVSCFGLPASGERFERGRFRQHYKVLRDGVPCFVDGFTLDDSNREGMASEAGLAGFPVSGFFLAGPFADMPEELPHSLRAVPRSRELAALSGVSAIGNFIVGRYLGSSAEDARALFTGWWDDLRPILLGRPACAPRIWLT